MDVFFGILLFLSLSCLIVGLIFPPLFTFLFRKIPSRGKIALTFGLSTLVCFILIGATAPQKTTTKEVSKATLTAKSTSSPTATPTPKQTATPTQTPTATP